MSSNLYDATTRIEHAANCPYCTQPHHYVETIFQVENDIGYWDVECTRCQKLFAINIRNPYESGGKIIQHVKGKHETPFTGDPSTVAYDVIRHSIDLNSNTWQFNYSAVPLYQCANGAADLEGAAHATLKDHFSGIAKAYHTAWSFLLKGGSAYDYAVVRVPVNCSCTENHTATFYTRISMDSGSRPISEIDFLLANVSGAELEETLDGIVSKSDAMDLLEKLIIRWNLLSEQILIVSPFVGTTYMSSAKQLTIWEWLLSILDSEKAVFLTRGATWTAYRKAMEEDGISVDLLEKYGLENNLVAMDVRKQDFHAKFFAGVSDTSCEVMSGSANLVRGPSVENIGFRVINKLTFQERYIKKNEAKKTASHSQKIFKTLGFD